MAQLWPVLKALPEIRDRAKVDGSFILTGQRDGLEQMVKKNLISKGLTSVTMDLPLVNY